MRGAPSRLCTVSFQRGASGRPSARAIMFANALPRNLLTARAAARLLGRECIYSQKKRRPEGCLAAVWLCSMVLACCVHNLFVLARWLTSEQRPRASSGFLIWPRPFCLLLTGTRCSGHWLLQRRTRLRMRSATPRAFLPLASIDKGVDTNLSFWCSSRQCSMISYCAWHFSLQADCRGRLRLLRFLSWRLLRNSRPPPEQSPIFARAVFVASIDLALMIL